ncbi:DUF1410 domain-containing protein [Ureaplasma urealyticum]|uniref:DUF1410 domain-containing protein n=1 Tax=Ureaplasma urealyticum TaxID=2130 RepID=A0AAP9DEF2_UREUR|nr:DUF1410 domain-containing protein [Ureaplasma urealyticum]QDL88306.1 DUF1410 domain-containing protein [Ureaplasma urealyticum]
MDFGNAPTPSPTPTPTPTPEPTPTLKKDEVVISNVTFTKDEKKKDEATVSLVFSKLELADSSKKLFSLEITKKDDTNPIKASDLKYDEASKTLTGKLTNLTKGEYSISKLTLNNNEINLNDTVKNSKLLIEDQNNNGNGGNEQGGQPSNPNKDEKIQKAEEKLAKAKEELNKVNELVTTKDTAVKEATKALETAKADAKTKEAAVTTATRELEEAKK